MFNGREAGRKEKEVVQAGKFTLAWLKLSVCILFNLI